MDATQDLVFSSNQVNGCDKIMSSEIIKNLVLQAKNGSTEAFAELYEMYSRDMFRFAYYYLGGVQAAEDAVSEATLLAYQKLDTLKKNEAFKSWLFKILYNCCNSALKEKIASQANVEISQATYLSVNDTDPAERISLLKALDHLSEQDREIVVLYYCSGYNSKEIGKLMNLKDSTVRSRILRSVEKLRKILTI